MASTADPLFKVELQGAGDNPGAWHTPLNNALSQIVEGTSQLTSINVSSADVTLTDTQYVSNQARSGGFLLTGTLAANRVVTAPDREKLYYIHDTSAHAGFTLTFKVASGTQHVTLLTGFRYWIYCDGATKATCIASSDPAFATTSGTNSIVITTTPAQLTYYTGMELNVTFTSGNTSAAYATVDGLGYKQIVKDTSSSLASGDISAGMSAKLMYDGTNLVMFVPKIAAVLGLVYGGVQTGDFNAAVNTRYVVDCDPAAAITATGPAAPTIGDVIVFSVFGVGLFTFALNGLKFNGFTTNPTSSADGISTLTYTGTDRGWVEG